MEEEESIVRERERKRESWLAEFGTDQVGKYEVTLE